MTDAVNKADWIEVEGSDGLDLGKYNLRIESRRLLGFIAERKKLPYAAVRQEWVERVQKYVDEFICDLALDIVDEVTEEGLYRRRAQ